MCENNFSESNTKTKGALLPQLQYYKLSALQMSKLR